MEQVLMVGSVIPAALGAGCCVVGRRSPLPVVAAMLVMVAAMADTMALGGRLMSAASWTVLLAALSVALLVLWSAGRAAIVDVAHSGVMTVLFAAMAGEGSAPGASMAGMRMDGPDVLTFFACAAAALFAGRMLLGRRACSPVARVEHVATACSALAMAGMALTM